MMIAPMSASEFPVPADLAGSWQFDQVHAPRPLTPLSQDLILGAVSEGFCSGLREAGYPLGLCYRAVNCYAYAAFLPFDAQPDVDEQPARNRETPADLIPRLGGLWETEWLPSILPGFERLRTLDYAALIDAELLATLDDLRRDLVARWRVHGFLLFSYEAASTFDDFYRAVFDPADPAEAYLLLNGFETRALDSNRGFWRLRRVIREHGDLLRLFEQTEPPALVKALAGSDEGRSLMRELWTFLDEYGWRGDGIFELAEPMWREDLSIPLNALRGLLALDDSEDPDALLRRIAERRERLLAQARTRLAGDPERLAQFDALYEHARHHVVLDENHNFYIDQMGNAALRLPVLELGRRLVQHGVIDELNDVFMLSIAEIQSGLADVDRRALVAARRAAMAHWQKITPPSTLGEPASEEEVDPLMAAMIKLDAPPPEQEQAATVIKGTPASPGVVQGRARVARSLEEASSVEPGEILVCEMTLPPWSVLFGTIGAVVADTGGVLSHCATVAREFGIPCVVGTIAGTSLIPNGSLLAVDGTQGTVRIIASPA